MGTAEEEAREQCGGAHDRANFAKCAGRDAPAATVSLKEMLACQQEGSRQSACFSEQDCNVMCGEQPCRCCNEGHSHCDSNADAAECKVPAPGGGGGGGPPACLDADLV